MEPQIASKEANGWRTFGIVVITMFVTIVGGYWIFTQILFPSSFTPVHLSKDEQLNLDKKLRVIGITTEPVHANVGGTKPTLEPERYTEIGARREVHFSEREVNAVLAHNTDLADKFAIDLDNNLASAKLLLPLDPEMPFFGGKTLKATAGLEVSIGKGNPRVILVGISVWGVPIPNAWLGNMKNKNLLDEFGHSGGFWQSFQEGIESVEIGQGEVMVKLKK